MLLILYVVNKNLNIEGVFVWYVIYIWISFIFRKGWYKSGSD